MSLSDMHHKQGTTQIMGSEKKLEPRNGIRKFWFPHQYLSWGGGAENLLLQRVRDHHWNLCGEARVRLHCSWTSPCCLKLIIKLSLELCLHKKEKWRHTLVWRSKDSFSCRCFPALLARSIHFPLNHLTFGFRRRSLASTLAINVIFPPFRKTKE